MPCRLGVLREMLPNPPWLPRGVGKTRRFYIHALPLVCAICPTCKYYQPLDVNQYRHKDILVVCKVKGSIYKKWR
jgi:hypothetical protein